MPMVENEKRTLRRTRRFGRLKGAWIFVASGALALFTVFVLLDTFAIARVQQTALAADYSSIVNAQGESGSASSGSESAGSSAGDSASASSGADASSSASAESSKGKHKRGSGGPGGNSSGSSKKSSSTASDSTAVAGAAQASSDGEQIGTYSDDNMQVAVSKVRAYDTDIYVADVQVSSAAYLKTALAQNSFGRNLKDTTSNMADAAGAVLAINGDYYGFRDYGYVLRNGVLYRDTAASGTDALVVYGDGSMGAVSQDEASAQQLKDSGAWQVLSFGPVLVNDGKVAVSADDEVDQSMGSNPRTAIGMVSPLHYVVVVSDGRTDDNAGLSLNQLAQVLVDNGATFAYNLDGGGSTTMYFQGEVLNSPTSGNRDGERQVSDIVYFG
ncbi:MAG: phosphodiester glycosidase family protein [Eggerthellaceae bacterium]|nr:phosphodiester glycosidase family protein [Eggerthellaceae bacterium]